jgi:hypothetical protein
MEDREYLLHIERAIREIQDHTSGFSREDYERDSKTQLGSWGSDGRSLDPKGSEESC